MVDSIETYEATLSEVRRQAAQLSRLISSGGEEAGGAADAGRRSGSGSGSIASEASNDWVVLESSTPLGAACGRSSSGRSPMKSW